MTHTPVTLGEKLAAVNVVPAISNLVKWRRRMLYFFTKVALVTTFTALALWWIILRPDIDQTVMLISLAGLLALWWGIDGGWRSLDRGLSASPTHPLLANDRQRFMGDLRLDAKTAIFDGSNIYHLGHDHGFDARPLGEIVNQLRDQGYRIVCFFDANIFYTLSEHGAFPSQQPHSVALLEDIFGLKRNEIYVVPSGVQADKYVLESLKYLPISFAVSNDHYRDYAKPYQAVMKDKHWRKGVMISKNRVELLGFSLPNPIHLS